MTQTAPENDALIDLRILRRASETLRPLTPTGLAREAAGAAWRTPAYHARIHPLVTAGLLEGRTDKRGDFRLKTTAAGLRKVKDGIE